VKPKIMVCLGATAAKTLLGSGFWVTRDRGELVETDLAPIATGTVQPIVDPANRR
jgi:DNA polymerase